MKLAYKILLVHIAIAIFVTILISFSMSGFTRAEDVALGFGIVCLGIGLIDLFMGFILLLAGTAEWRNGFFLSGAALLLLSGISCGGGAAFG